MQKQPNEEHGITYCHNPHPDYIDVRHYTAFRLTSTYVPKNSTTEKTVYVFGHGQKAQADFLRLLAGWNRTPEWIYAPLPLDFANCGSMI